MSGIPMNEKQVILQIPVLDNEASNEIVTVRNLRKKYDLSAEDLCSMTGIARTTLSRLENPMNLSLVSLRNNMSRLLTVFTKEELEYVRDAWIEETGRRKRSPEEELIYKNSVLKGLRLRHKMSKEQLCKATGISKTTLDRLENFKGVSMAALMHNIPKLGKVFSAKELEEVVDAFNNFLKARTIHVYGTDEENISEGNPDVMDEPVAPEEVATLKSLRSKHRLSIKEVADMAGVTPATVWQWESKDFSDLRQKQIEQLKRVYSDDELDAVRYGQAIPEISRQDDINARLNSIENLNSELTAVFELLSMDGKNRLVQFADYLYYQERGLAFPAVFKS